MLKLTRSKFVQRYEFSIHAAHAAHCMFWEYHYMLYNNCENTGWITLNILKELGLDM